MNDYITADERLTFIYPDKNFSPKTVALAWVALVTIAVLLAI